MDTRRSKSASDSKKTSPNQDGGKGNVEKQENSSSEQESVSDGVDSKVAEAPDSTSPNREKSGMVTRSVGKSFNKEVKSKKEKLGKGSPAKSKAASLSESTRDSPEFSSESPQPKRRKTDKQGENDHIELSGNDEESSQEDDSFSGDPLPAGNSQESKITSGEKAKVVVTSLGQDVKINAGLLGKAPLIKVKRVVKGPNEGEINVVTSYEDSGPVKNPSPGEAVPQSAKKYMILDKATIKEMMEKGLVQTIKKDGTNPTIATYRAVVPKGETSFLNKLASASLSSLPPVLNINSVPQTVGASKPIGNPALSTTFKPVSGTSTLISSLPSVPSKSLMTILTSSTAPPSLVSSATTMSSSGTVGVPSSGVKIQIPSATLSNGKASSIPQVFTSPIFVKTPATSTAGKQGNLKVVAFPPDVLQQLQHIQKKAGASFSVSASTTTSGKPIFTIASGSQPGVKVITREGTEATAVSNTDDPDDPDFSPCVELSDDSGEEGIAKQKEKGKYGVPTGVSKNLKSMKMYEFVNKNKKTGVTTVAVNKTGNNNVRWVAVPNKPIELKSAGGAPNMPTTIPIRFSTSGKDSAGSSQLTIPSESQVIGGDELYNHYKIQELRAKQKEQLSHHRKRYLELLRTYNELANKYNEIKDVGTMKQILTDAKKYMKKDHILFFRNEMMLHDRLCNGNRYSPKFMMMLMKYYNRSHIGYRFLRRIFTLPAVRTLITWQNKKLPLKKKKSALKPQEHVEITVNGNKQGILYPESQSHEETGVSSQLSDQHLGASLKSTGDDSESYCDSDSEVEDFEEDSIEVNSKEIHKTVVSNVRGHHSSNSGVLMEFDEH